MAFPLIQESFKQALAVIIPVRCSGCGQADTVLCSDCQASIAIAPEDHSEIMGHSHPIVASTEYQGAIRAALLDYKEQGRTALDVVLAEYLQEALYELVAIVHRRYGPCLPERLEILVPPQRRQAQRKRGYHPVEHLLKTLGLTSSRVLEFVNSSADQGHLSASERAENMQFVFRAQQNLRGRAFVVVDDIVTTGATISELSRAISAAGGWYLGAALICFTPLRRNVLPVLG